MGAQPTVRNIEKARGAMRDFPKVLVVVAFLAASVASATSVPAISDGWITHPDAARSAPIVLHFRRSLDLAAVPASLPITITADNRFVLHVNGERVASGPSVGTPARWRYATLDLATHLRPGRNVIAAVVWNFGEAAPVAHTTV